MIAAGTTTSLDGDFLLKFLLACLFFLQIVALALGIVRHRSQQKREVSFAAEMVERREFAEHRDRNDEVHTQIFAKVGGLERGLRQEIKDDTDVLHEKINAVAREVAGLSTSNNLQNQRLVQIDEKLNRLIERT